MEHRDAFSQQEPGNHLRATDINEGLPTQKKKKSSPIHKQSSLIDWVSEKLISKTFSFKQFVKVMSNNLIIYFSKPIISSHKYGCLLDHLKLMLISNRPLKEFAICTTTLNKATKFNEL